MALSRHECSTDPKSPKPASKMQDTPISATSTQAIRFVSRWRNERLQMIGEEVFLTCRLFLQVVLDWQWASDKVVALGRPVCKDYCYMAHWRLLRFPWHAPQQVPRLQYIQLVQNAQGCPALCTQPQCGSCGVDLAAERRQCNGSAC